MTELFNGGEMDAFSPSDNAVIESTVSSFGPRWNSTFARCSIRVGTGSNVDTSYAETAHWTAQAEGYLRFDQYCFGATVFTGTMTTLVTAAGTEVFRIRAASNGHGHTLTLQYLNASAVWTTAGTVDVPEGTLVTYDLYWKVNASGALSLFVSGTERITWTGDTSHLSNISYARLWGLQCQTDYSQVMADTDPTIGHRLATCYPSGAGATSSWTGSYAEIDEAVYSDSDFINSASANQVTTVAATVATLSGYTVQSVTVSARANRDASGPQNLQLALRVSGTDYFSASKALSAGYAPAQNTWATNPATAGAWTNSITSLQPGVKSIT